MIQFPYGIADFRRIRQERRIYVDRTSHIRDMERLGEVLVFLRPRRFGKSLWLQTLANYYDLRRASEFDELFGDLAIGADPTESANRYFVLQWNFSTVDSGGSIKQIAESLREHVATCAKVFVSQYQGALPGSIEVDGSSAAILRSLLAAVSETPHGLYLLIDEYDNFVNEVMVEDTDTYHALFGKGGPYKQLFKSVKNATEGQGLERVFVTGVSPVALSDLTSGFNNAEDVSRDSDLATLCGFREEEIVDIFKAMEEEREFSPGALDEVLATMRTWYNGYRFAAGGEELVYNPTNVLYFLKHFHRKGRPPRRLHDENLRTDRVKLAFLARSAAGAGVIERLTEGGDDVVEISELEESFSLDDLVQRMEKDPDAVASFLYYMGLLTQTDTPFRLRIPNLVVRKLFLDRLLEIFLPDLGDSSEARKLALDFFRDGELGRLLAFFEAKLLSVLSNRDRGAAPREPWQSGSGVNEMVVKALFLSMLFDDSYYRTYSEPELDKGYADLCLLVRPEARRYGFFDFLFELKLVRRKELGKKAKEIAAVDDAELRQLPSVAKAFSDGREKLERYRAALVKREGELRLRCYVVVAAGLERIVGEEIEVI